LVKIFKKSDIIKEYFVQKKSNSFRDNMDKQKEKELQEKLGQLYHNLKIALEKPENEEEIIRISTEILDKFPTEIEAFICKVTALTKQNDFQTAKQLIDKFSPKKHPQIAYLQAYCLYKLNKYDECLMFIYQIKPGYFEKSDPKEEANTIENIKLLEVQCLQKNAKFDIAIEKCTDIMQKHIDSEYFAEILVNQLSMFFLQNGSKFKDQIMKTAEDYLKRGKPMKEVLFNMSLVYDKCDRVFESKNMLKSFQGIVQEEMKIEKDDPQLNSDRILCEVQMDYFHLKDFEQSKEDRKEKITEYKGFVNKDFLDSNVKTVLSNNLCCMQFEEKEDQNFNEAIGLLGTAEKTDTKITKPQFMTMKLNEIIVSIIKSRHIETLKLLKSLEEKFTKEELLTRENYILCKAFYLLKSKMFDDLENFLKESKKNAEIKTLVFILEAEINRQRKLADKWAEFFPKDLNEVPKEKIDSLLFLILAVGSKSIDTLTKEKALIFSLSDKTKNIKLTIFAGDVFLLNGDYETAAMFYKKVLALTENKNEESLHKTIYALSFHPTPELQNFIKMAANSRTK